MSTVNNSIARINSRYLQSLVDYMLDVKPYRTKLAPTGAISEEYIFSDVVNVNIKDTTNTLTALGAFTLEQHPIQGINTRLPRSYVRNLISDGFRRVWPMVNFTAPKLSSHSNRSTFEIGHPAYDYTGIPGLNIGAVDQRRWGYNGFSDLRLNGIQQQDGLDCFASSGVFSFDVEFSQSATSKPYWRQHDLNLGLVSGARNIFPAAPGELLYKNSYHVGGTLTDIYGETYEAFYAECISENPSVLEIYSPHSDTPVGTVSYGDTFELLDGSNNVRIRFTFTSSLGTSHDGGVIGDRYEISPFNKIAISDDALEETWSLIKVNPIKVTSTPEWIPNPSVPRPSTPAIQIHATSIEFTQASDWEIEFIGDGRYELRAFSPGTNDYIAGYPKIAALQEGCSYRDDNISFTLIPIPEGYAAGDKFAWALGDNTAHFKVFGSVSGWTTDLYSGLDASVGKWFWNGKIGFKVPKLQLFTEVKHSTIATYDTTTTSWESQASNRLELDDIQYKDGVFFAVSAGRAVLASLDGVTWTDDIASLWIPSANDKLVYAFKGGKIQYSSDGFQWFYATTNVSVDLHSVASATNLTPTIQTRWVTVGDNGTVLVSDNAIDWSASTVPTTEDLYCVVWSGTAFIAVGNNGCVIRSDDGINWSNVNNTPNVDDLRTVVTTPTALFIGGTNSAILRSTSDGTTWSDLNPFSMGTAEFTDIAYANGTYIAVSSYGVTAYSLDGIIWTAHGGKAFRAVESNGDVIVAVGGSMSDAAQFNIATDGSSVSAMAEPSTYTITFTKSSDYLAGIVGEATVFNNITGFGRNLRTDQLWSDAWIKFTLSTGQFDYRAGDEIKIYVADSQQYPSDISQYNATLGYDGYFYDLIGYDGGELGGRGARSPRSINSELFPLYHSHGAIIFPNATVGDVVTVDKAFTEEIKFKINGASTLFPELAPQSDYIPLYFKFNDFVADPLPATPFDYDTSTTDPAHFSDFAPFIEAFSSASGQRIFSLVSPRHEKTNRAANTRIIFDKDFFTTYMPYYTKYSLEILPQNNYGQIIRVKISEALEVYSRIELNVNDIAMVNIGELNHSFHYPTANLFFGEGPITGYWRWTDSSSRPTVGPGLDPRWSLITPFNSPDDQAWTYPFNISLADGQVALSNGYDLFGYDMFFGYDESTGIIPQVYVSDNFVYSTDPTATLESASSSISEGLSITINANNSDPELAGLSATTLYYDFAKSPDGILVDAAADRYTVSMFNIPNTMSSPNVIVAPEANWSAFVIVASNFATYTYLDGSGSPLIATDVNSVTFTLPPEITSPFRIWLT